VDGAALVLMVADDACGEQLLASGVGVLCATGGGGAPADVVAEAFRGMRRGTRAAVASLLGSHHGRRELPGFLMGDTNPQKMPVAA
jgi:hypothetical protein